MRILVTGGDGLVGRALARLRPDLVVLGRRECDVLVDRERVLAEVRPDVVIFCAAHTEVDSADTPHGWRLNAEAPGQWARQVETWFLSSNFVFDGRGPHLPGERPTPRSPYARQKVQAETEVLAAGGHVARVGWVWGPGGRTFASRLVERLQGGERVKAIVDVLVQPTHADDLAASLLELPRGVSHHAGAGEVSWYGFALAVAARVGGQVEPVRLAELGLARPRDARLAPATLRPWWDQILESTNGGGTR